MKKTAVLASMFAIIISGIYCTKADETLKNDKVEVSYAKAPSTSDESDPSVFADHLIRMENIQFGSNSLSMLSKVAEWRNAQAKYGNLVSGVRYSYNHSPVQVTEIPISSGPIKGSKESVLVYSYNGNAMVAVMKVSTFNELTTYAVTDVNGEAYYSITLNTANQIKGWSLLRDFSKEQLSVFKGPEGVSAAGGSTCPQLYPNSFSSCFRCAVNECSNDLLCTLACGVWPASCVAGFTLACTVPIQ